MYCIQWSLSAGLFKGPVLSIIRIADSMSTNCYFLNFFNIFFQFIMKDNGSFYCSLSVKFGRVGNFE